MFYFYKILRSLLLPPGLFVLIFFATALFVRRRSVRIFLIISAIVTYLMSIYPTTILLKKMIVPPQSPIPKGVDVVVVMGGGLTDESISRLVKGKEIHDITGAPVLITGYNDEARMMRRKLLSIGLDSSFLIVDTSSRNTFESVRNVAGIVKRRGFSSVVVVSTDYHLRRVMMEFSKYGIRVHPVASNPRRDRIKDALDLFPSMSYFYKNYIYVKELIGSLVFSLLK